MNVITSDTRLPHLNVNFRISAGPGAGKTHWLVQHILGVIQQPHLLGKHGKVACLTYTNIGADTLVQRLGAAASSCFLGTVHSFLYKNVVKPYIGFIAAELGIDPTRLDGYDEAIISDFEFLKQWKHQTGQKYLLDNDSLVKALAAYWWTVDANGKSVLARKPKKFIKVNNKYLKNGSALIYKNMAWKWGIFHPDDILYFSRKLLDEHPIISSALRARFPFLFIDEFQDSNPIQVKIFQHFSNCDIFVGIIGDAAQSIYGFNGASPEDFSNFNSPSISDYVMLENRRSSNEIIDLLNHVRKDISQVPVRKVSMGTPEILVGSKLRAIDYVKSKVGENFTMLSRNNETVQELKDPGIVKAVAPKLFAQMASSDANYERREITKAMILGITQARILGLSFGVTYIKKALSYCCDKNMAKKYAIVYLLELLEHQDEYYTGTLTNFLNSLRRKYGLAIANLAEGSAKRFYDKCLFSEISAQVIADDKSANRTIHKSKGDEFQNVLLFLESEKLDVLLSPKIFGNKQEEQRIIYVAFSRARDRLFIHMPEISEEQRAILPPIVIVQSV